MKKYPSYIDSLISELQSSELANEILQRYKKYSSNPILIELYESFSECQNQFFFSSRALGIINSSLVARDLNDTFTTTYYDHHIDELVKEEELGLSPLPTIQDSSLSTMWSQASCSSSAHKTLKQLSYDVKQFIMQKKKCTYKEVADEIVKNEAMANEKNIRRRVYDAINVLTAAKVCEKQGKLVCILEGNVEVKNKLNKKKEQLRKISLKYQNLNGIISRNKNTPNYRKAIQLPFIIIITKKNVRYS